MERDVEKLRDDLAKQVVTEAGKDIERHQELLNKGLFGRGLDSTEEAEVEKLETGFNRKTIDLYNAPHIWWGLRRHSL